MLLINRLLFSPVLYFYNELCFVMPQYSFKLQLDSMNLFINLEYFHQG